MLNWSGCFFIYRSHSFAPALLLAIDFCSYIFSYAPTHVTKFMTNSRPVSGTFPSLNLDILSQFFVWKITDSLWSMVSRHVKIDKDKFCHKSTRIYCTSHDLWHIEWINVSNDEQIKQFCGWTSKIKMNDQTSRGSFHLYIFSYKFSTEFLEIID